MGGGEPTASAGAGGSVPARIGRYHIVAELGAGGMGKVYRAVDPNLGREVAVKTVLAAGIDGPLARARFDREARALAALRHDNVLAVHDYSGLDADPVYLVTELVDGTDLGALLSRRGRLSASEAVAALRQVAAGLAAAHAAGLIHRDVKPANILVDRSGRAVLADFGVARPPTSPAAEGSTASLTFAGTPGYMSPEQIEGRDLDARTDLWSLGAAAYELATGDRPFGGRNLHEALGRALEGDYRRAADRPELDPELAALIDRCLSRDRDRRPAAAAELVGACDRILARMGVADHRAALVGEMAADARDDLASAPTAMAPATPARRRLDRGAIALALAAVAIVVAAIAFIATRSGDDEPEADPVAGLNVAPVDAAATASPDAATLAMIPAPLPPTPTLPPRAGRGSHKTPTPSPSPSPSRSPSPSPSPSSSRDPATLSPTEQRELQALLMEANTASVRNDHATALAAAEKVLARTESQLALYLATEASCELGDAKRATRYYARMREQNLMKVTLDLCAVKGIYVTEAAKTSYWAIFNKLNKARTDAHAAFQRGDWQATLAAARILIADGQQPADRATGHEYATRAACGLGDVALAGKHLAAADPGDHGDLIDYCRRKHAIDLPRP